MNGTILSPFALELEEEVRRKVNLVKKNNI